MMYRKAVNKKRSARSFRKNAKRTKAANMSKSPQRGGWRL